MINTLHEEIYQARGHQFVAEYYADLFVPGRRRPDHHHASTRPVDPAGSRRALLEGSIEEGKTKSVNDVDVAVRADCICVHSDTPNAVAVAPSRYEDAVKPYSGRALPEGNRLGPPNRFQTRTNGGDSMASKTDPIAAARHLLPPAGAGPAGL